MVLFEVLVSLRFVDGLNQEVKGVSLLILNETALDDGVVSDVIWLDILLNHFLEHFDGLVDHSSLNASLNHASENEHTWLDSFSFHLIQNSKSFVNLSFSLVNLGKN